MLPSAKKAATSRSGVSYLALNESTLSELTYIADVEMFRLFVDLNQCRHIYFAGCHDTGFGSLLTPYRNRGDRITLIKGANFHREFEELNLPIRELPSVFMSTPLAVTTKQSTLAISKAAPTTNGIKPVCKHWQKV